MYNFLEQKQLIILSFEDLQKFAFCLAEQIMQERNEANKDEEKLLTTEEVTALLHCNRTTLWRWNKTGVLPHTKVGKSILYKESLINKILQKNEK